MNITLEQARAFEAVARLSTVQKAAAELHKGHSAVLYSLRVLEEQTGLKLFDRSGYRNALTLEGEIVLKYCRQLLATRRELEDVCSNIKAGWEPSLKLIYDGVVDFNVVGDALFHLNEMKAPTEVKVLTAHLNEVEALFTEENADMMVTILPLKRLQIPSLRLRPIKMHLVAHRDHLLGSSSRAKLDFNDLNRHTFIKIKAASEDVGLSTEQMVFESYFYVNEFASKKAAILKRLGFGWLPDYLIRKELKAGVLRTLKTQVESTHFVYPRIFHRPEDALGRAAREVIRFFKKIDVR